MLLLGHAGITFGIAELLNSALPENSFTTTQQNNDRERFPDSAESVIAQSSTSVSKTQWPAALVNNIDTRLLLIGSMLPDIVDKSVGLYFFRDTFSTGRIFCHTVLFLILITLAGVYLYKSRGKVWLLVLSFGTFTHLVLDKMWLSTQTLLWPLHGFAFEREDATDWTAKMLHALYTDPGVYLPEFMGAFILIWFVVMLVRKKKVYSFIKNGSVL